MTKHGIGNRVAVSLACAALGVMAGCADLQADDQQALSQDEAAPEVLEQRIVPPTSGPVSGENIKIEGVTASGSGCPVGSWEAEMVPENNAFTITFNNYSIDVAPPTGNQTAIKSLACNISIKVRTPRDLSYAVTSFQYFGYANLAQGMKGTLYAAYAFTGFGVAPTFKDLNHTFPIPTETTYAVNDDIVARGLRLFWAPCSLTSNLQVRTRLSAESKNKERPALLSIDNVDVRAQAALRINIRTGPCPVVNPAP
jgi:hypothetical protein